MPNSSRDSPDCRPARAHFRFRYDAHGKPGFEFVPPISRAQRSSSPKAHLEFYPPRASPIPHNPNAHFKFRQPPGLIYKEPGGPPRSNAPQASQHGRPKAFDPHAGKAPAAPAPSHSAAAMKAKQAIDAREDKLLHDVRARAHGMYVGRSGHAEHISQQSSTKYTSKRGSKLQDDAVRKGIIVWH